MVKADSPRLWGLEHCTQLPSVNKDGDMVVRNFSGLDDPQMQLKNENHIVKHNAGSIPTVSLLWYF